MLAFTNRFISLSVLVRGLRDKYVETKDHVILEQIQNLRKRLYLIRTMQVLGISSMLLCVVSMLLMYVKFQLGGEIVFGFAMLLMIISLIWSIREIIISVQALDLHLKFLEKSKDDGRA
jgi:hypothetical protein